jgi:hypothetical protein
MIVIGECIRLRAKTQKRLANPEACCASLRETGGTKVSDIGSKTLEDYCESYDSVFRSIPIEDVLEFAGLPDHAVEVLPSDIEVEEGASCHSDFTVVTKAAQINAGCQIWLEMAVGEDAMNKFRSQSRAYLQACNCALETVIFTKGKATPSLGFEPKIINLHDKDYTETSRRLESKAKAGEKVNLLELVFLPLIGKKSQPIAKAKKACTLILLCETDRQKRKKLASALAYASSKVLDADDQVELMERMTKFDLMDE